MEGATNGDLDHIGCAGSGRRLKVFPRLKEGSTAIRTAMGRFRAGREALPVDN